jgi:hypothetical protein
MRKDKQGVPSLSQCQRARAYLYSHELVAYVLRSKTAAAQLLFSTAYKLMTS